MNYDVIVLGGGPGGYVAAERAGHHGLKTLLIEKNALGGVCLNEGCIPSKTLLHSAKIFDYAKGYGKKYGVSCSNASIDHKFVVDRKNRVVKKLVSGVAASMKKNNVEVVYGEGSIIGRTSEGIELSVGDKKYSAKRLIIATGAQTIIPPIEGVEQGLKNGFVLTNREILSLDSVPESLVVVGGGVIGLEMASYYNSVGSKVAVIEMLDKIAGPNDTEISAILQKNYEKKGITFNLKTKVISIKENEVIFESSGNSLSVKCDRVLLSIGRRPVTSGFGIENLGVETYKGAIVIDDRCRTNIANVYAIGDCTAKSMLAHVAYRHADVAVNNIIGQKDVMNYSAVPSVIYTNPEVGAVGMTEEIAKNRGLDYSVVKIPLAYSGRYVAENEDSEGICKLLINNRYKTIVGAHIIGNPVSEFIAACVMMIEKEMTVNEIKKFIFPHPTVCEIIREAVFMY